MYIKKYSLLVLLLFLIACNRRTEYYQSFDKVVKISNYSEKVQPVLKPIKKYGAGQSFLLGRPADITYLNGYVFVIDKSKQSIHIFRNTEHIAKIGQYGRGPGEFQYIESIQVSPNKYFFWVYDANLFRYTKFDLEQILNNSALEKAVKDVVNIRSKVGYIISPVWINDTTIVSHGFFTVGRLAFFNGQGQFQKILGPRLPGKENIQVPYSVRGQTYMGSMAAKPDGSAFVLATQYSDKIEIYNASGHPEVLVIGSTNFEPNYEVAYPRGSPTMNMNENMRWGYIDVFATRDKIYALYSGKAQKNKNANFGKFLHIFNWKGHLLDIYPFKNQTIISICVDETNNRLFAIDYFAKQSIKTYKLPE